MAGNPIMDALLVAISEPIKTQSVFRRGQLVRVLNYVFEDGVTPVRLKNKNLQVDRVFTGGLLTKQWVYRLSLDGIEVGDFKEEELDSRRRARVGHQACTSQQDSRQ